MPRRLRYVVPGEMVEVTQRTFQGRPLLRPDPAFNRIFLGVLGRAQRRYKMTICAFIVLSNHYHLYICPRDARHQADFVGYLDGNLAREVAKLRDWPERVWGRRYAAVPVTSEPEAQIARLKYLLSQGVKEGLVAKALDWPGCSGLAQMLDPSHELVGVWYDRTTAYRRRKAGLEVRPEDWISEERVVLSPIPALERLSVAERRTFLEKLVREIEAEAQAALIRPVAGAETILGQDASSTPRKLRRSPIPLVHAASIAAWIAFKEAYRAFVAAYQLASTRLRAGVRDVVFPEGSFPPPMPFVSCAPP